MIFTPKKECFFQKFEKPISFFKLEALLTFLLKKIMLRKHNIYTSVGHRSKFTVFIPLGIKGKRHCPFIPWCYYLIKATWFCSMLEKICRIMNIE